MAEPTNRYVGDGDDPISGSDILVPVGKVEASIVAGNRYLAPDHLAGTDMNSRVQNVPSRIETQKASIDDVLNQIEWTMVNDPEQYEIWEDYLRDTRFSSFESFLTAASYQDEPWEEFLPVRAEYDASRPGRGGGGGGGPYTRRNEQLRISDEVESKQLLDAAMLEAFGRTASDDEAAVFQKVLNKKQKKNPAVTITKGTGGANDQVQSITKPGFDSQAYAVEYAKSQDGYAPRQAAKQLLGAVDRLISSRPANAAEGLIMGGMDG
jgi:hypothetical protein